MKNPVGDDKKANRNTEGLARTAKESKEASIEGAKKAVAYFKRSKVTKVTAKLFAEKAEISVATIYNNEIIETMFNQVKALKAGTEVTPSLTPTEKKKQETKGRITRLIDQVNELKQDKADLVAQNAALTTEIIGLKSRLKAIQRPVANIENHRNKL